tara:strand:+ start:17073 stop:17954 length:882 start_codon:yes stop_codon:yes gene_type:complete
MPPKAKSPAQAYHARKRALTQASEDRRIRIINTTIGQFRTFSGTITIPSRKDAKAPDATRLQDIADPATALVYWADGSQSRSGVNDVLGAGVAWQDEQEWQSAMFSLGLNTGEVKDAELFGIAAALHLAVERVVDGGEAIALVRVFSDSQNVLSGLQDGSITTLGPAIGKNWALENLFERADWLATNGARVELVWVKGHSGSQGNWQADAKAAEAVGMQCAALGEGKRRRRVVGREDAPEEMRELGEDAVEEWFWRVNGELVLSGVEEMGCDEEGMSEGSAAMDISDDDEDCI